MESSTATFNNLEGSIFLAGSRITLAAVVAICEAYARENFELFSILVSIVGEANPSEIKDYVNPLREIIRDHAAASQFSVSSSSSSTSTSNSNSNAKMPSYQQSYQLPLPPPPPIPSSKRTPSQLDYEEACRIAEEEDRRLREEAEQRDHLEAEKLAKMLEEEYQASISFHCQICLTNHSIHGCYTLECGHRFCEECISGYICSKINSHEVNDDTMICPLEKCGIPIQHTIIRGCTKDLNNCEAYDKYCEFKKDTFIANEIQNGCMLRCPTESCNYVFYYSLNSSHPLSFTCESCRYSYCINCRVLHDTTLQNNSSSAASRNSKTTTTTGRGHFGPGHPPYTCQQQIERLHHDEQERKKLEEWRVLNENAQKLFEEAIKSKGWKQCPKCNVYIERNEGCDHMTCRVCKCNFCYICGKYDQANPLNRGDCGTSCPRK